MAAVVTLAQLNKDQRTAFNAIQRFLRSTKHNKKFFRLSGYAGTGKTFLLKVLHRYVGFGRAVFASPTNKATKIIKKTFAEDGVTVDCKTIYSLLGIKMVSDEDRLVLEFPKIPTNLSGYDVIYVDESSMLGSALLEYIYERAEYGYTKWVFIGDKAQIPPVGERRSPIWTLQCSKAYLTKVERYDNEILELATHVREQVTSYPNVDLQIHSNHSANEGVWKYRREKFFHNLQEYARRGLFSKQDHVTAIAWRNRTVNEMNAIIREAIFGVEAAKKSKWLPGDRLSVGEPIQDQGRVLAHIEDEGTVLSSEVVNHTIYKDMRVYYVVVQIDDGPAITLHVIHEECEALLQIQLNELAIKAKADPSQWKFFWMMRNSFHNARHGYAKTSHRVQGSTYKDVFVDTSDILANSNSREALRCLYVAFTRPTTKLILT